MHPSPLLLQTNTTEPSSRPVTGINFQGLFGQFLNPEGLAMLGILLVLILLSKLTGKKGQLTSGRFTGTGEKLQATRLALKQIQIQKCQPVTLWSGTPAYWSNRFKGISATVQTLLGASPTVWFPNAERGTLVIGAPGSGKTFSVIDRMLESSFQQGFSTLVYDKKGSQLQLHAPLAVRYGYDVQVFAPGESYSGVINPLDFMRDAQDAVMAGQIGKVIATNASTASGKQNEFFENAGQMMAKGLVQLAKSSPYPDLGMVYALIQLPNFVERLAYSAYRPEGHPLKMNRWIAASFSQLLSSKDAEKTVAGIKATAEATYAAFIQKDLLRAFIGRSTIPIHLGTKQAIFFKLDDQKRDIISPLLAATIHLCIIANLAQKRHTPLVYSLDEFPSLRLDQIVYWVNEYRSNGGVPIIGIQSLNQLYDRYGDKQGKAIASALSTHILFNPGDYDTAELYSKRYGETETILKNRSTGRSMGHHSSRSLNWNEQLHKKPLISADEILRFPQGKCVITSPAYGSGHEALFPYRLKIPVKKADIERAEASESLWESQIKPQLEQRAKSHSQNLDLDQELDNRIRAAYQLLPHPNETDTVGESQAGTIDTETIEHYRQRIQTANIGNRE
jgi:type IV secretion system protein VirD4